MGSKVLFAAIGWLALCQAVQTQKVNISVLKDNVSAESAPRLYRNVQSGVYASSAPYATFSYYPLHSALRGPQGASSQVSPVVAKDDNTYLKNLKDSYGKFVASHQAAAYKSAFPQQFLPIQALPMHLRQPLVAAAAPMLQYRPVNPNFIFKAHYKGPYQYASSSSRPQATNFASNSQPLVYGQSFPSSLFFSYGNNGNNFGVQQQSATSGNQLNYARAPIAQQAHQQKQGSSSNGQGQSDSNEGTRQIQASPAQTHVTAIVNGKKTVVTLETQPPLPLLDLNLLEPLHFDNPIVPQVQHFLPKINSATYNKLPEFNVEDGGKNHNVVYVQTTDTYDDSDEQKKQYSKKKSKSRPKNVPAQTPIVVSGDPNGVEYSYEINTPNSKEIVNEQVVTYNKVTNSQPMTVTYNTKTQNEPKVYTYSQSTKEPLKVTHKEYSSNEEPRQLIYTLTPAEQEEVNKNFNQEQQRHEESPEPENNDNESSHEQDDDGDTEGHTEENGQYNDRHHSYENESERQSEAPVSGHVHGQSNQWPHDNSYYDYQRSPNRQQGHSNKQQKETSTTSHNGPQQTSFHLQPEHRGQEYKQKPSSSPNQPHYSQPLSLSMQTNFQPITPVYAGMRIVTAQVPNAPIRVDPAQHVQLGPPTTYYELVSSTPRTVSQSPLQNTPRSPTFAQNVFSTSQRPGVYVTPGLGQFYSAPFSASPQINEKKQVESKEEEEQQEETPVKSPIEQMMDAMMDKLENDEEGFEKAYKQSAYGFPAYDESGEADSQEQEKDAFDPASYGVPAYHTAYDIENSPYEKYQKEEEEFPKQVRAMYKDAKDDNKEDYYLRFSASKPDIYADYYKKKEDYFKNYKQHRPKKVYNHEDSEEKEKKAKYIVASPSFVYPSATRQKPRAFKLGGEYKSLSPIGYNFRKEKKKERDNEGYASAHYHKHRTRFVEPQLHYGFEPVSPIVLDSELAAMASNHSPESEKPGTRKKVYKENWYIKKTSTIAGKPS